MSTYQITRSRKDGPDNDRRIDALEINGSVYNIDQVIVWIESGQYRFYTIVWGQTAYVYVHQRGLYGRKYLTTSPDGFGPNNLLKLPDC